MSLVTKFYRLLCKIIDANVCRFWLCFFFLKLQHKICADCLQVYKGPLSVLAVHDCRWNGTNTSDLGYFFYRLKGWASRWDPACTSSRIFWMLWKLTVTASLRTSPMVATSPLPRDTMAETRTSSSPSSSPTSPQCWPPSLKGPSASRPHCSTRAQKRWHAWLGSCTLPKSFDVRLALNELFELLLPNYFVVSRHIQF